MTAGGLAIVMGGGAARGAYQAGVLRQIADRYPELPVSILTGVSAGAINAVYLASQPGTFRERARGLCEMWARIEVDDVFRTDLLSLSANGLRWVLQLALLGGRAGVPNPRGLVDTAPLEGFLGEAFCTRDGCLDGVRRNLEHGLRAVAVTATDYSTGDTVTFGEGDSVPEWDGPKRRSLRAQLRLRHVLASAALPIFFPAVEVDGTWYGDGGMRLHSPLAPATHLGADRILALSTRHAGAGASRSEANVRPGYPPPAQIISVLFNAIFQDNLEEDAIHMQRINELVAAAPGRTSYRSIALTVIRPSLDLGREANAFEARLPGAFRFLTRRLGTRQQRSQDLLSMLMFQSDYLCRLMEIGEQDARAQADEIAALVEAG